MSSATATIAIAMMVKITMAGSAKRSVGACMCMLLSFFILLPHKSCIGIVQIELTASGSSTSVKGGLRPFRFKLDCSDGQVQSA